MYTYGQKVSLGCVTTLTTETDPLDNDFYSKHVTQCTNFTYGFDEIVARLGTINQQIRAKPSEMYRNLVSALLIQYGTHPKPKQLPKIANSSGNRFFVTSR